MSEPEERRSWFGMGGQPSLPPYFKPARGGRLKGLDEFEEPEFVRRTSRAERGRELGRWVITLGGFALGVALGVAVVALTGR